MFGSCPDYRTYYTVADGKQENLQMVGEDCIPVASLLRLIDRQP